MVAQAGDGQEAGPNAAVAVAPRVLVRDAQGAPVAGVPVSFAVEAGGGTVAGGPVTTGADGVATAGAWTLGPLPGENRLRATAGALSVAFTAQVRLLVPTTVVAGSVVLPPGVPVAATALRVVNGLTEVPVQPGGSFSIAVEPGPPQLAGVQTAQGEPLLFGWLDGTPKVLSARSTAEVLAWFDAGGFLLPDTAHRRILRQGLATHPGLGPLEAAIAQALAAEPAALTLATPAVELARKAVQAGLAAGAASAGRPRGILIDPSAEKSGVTVDQTGFRSITITNNWRRRLYAFVDRVGYVPKGSNQEVPSPLAGQPIPISAVTSVTSVIGTIADLLTGNFGWTPVVAPPQPVALAPADALSTRYRVTVVGSGQRTPGVPLSALQSERAQRAAFETVLLDLVIPLIDQILNADNLSRYLSNQAEVTSLVHQFTDLNPQNLLLAMGSGDWKAIWSEVLKLLFDTSAGQSFFYETLIVPNAAKKGLKQIQSADAVAKRWSALLTAIEIIATSADIAFVLKHTSESKEAEQWDVTVGGATVTLTPPAPIIFTHESPNIQAFVQEATGGTGAPFVYRWTTTGTVGKLCGQDTDRGASYCGPTFDTPKDIVAYAPHGLLEGTDQIKVEVLLLEGGTLHAVGEATITIRVNAPKVYLSPVNQSVLPGQTATFTGSVDAQLLDGGVVTYRWRTPGAYGNFGTGITDLESTQASVGYVANPTDLGTDPITLEVYSTLNGTRRLLGSVAGSVEVSRRPTIVLGTWTIAAPVALDAGRQCVAAYLTFPLVEDAKSYELYAYGFNDTATGRTEIRDVLTPPFNPWVGCGLATGWGQDGAAGSEYRIMLTGIAGPAASIGAAVAAMQTRFGGMVVEVTVRY